MQDSSLVFASCGNPDVFWPSIVEKAYAKLHGSYSILQGGSVADALVDLTGHLHHFKPNNPQNIPNLNTEVCVSSFNVTLKRSQVEWL